MLKRKVSVEWRPPMSTIRIIHHSHKPYHSGCPRLPRQYAQAP